MITKILAISIAAAVSLAPFYSYAADVTVTCSTGSLCSTSLANPALFEITNAGPGASVTRSIDIVNKHSKPCEIHLAADNALVKPADFDERLFTVIQSGAANIYGITNSAGGAADAKSLDVLFNETSGIRLGNVAGGKTRTYEWTITLDPAAGNDYQDANVTFDFDLEFACEDPPNINNDSGEADDDDNEGDDTDNNLIAGSSDNSGSNESVAGTSDLAAVPKSGAGKVLGDFISRTMPWLTKLPSTGTSWDGALYGMLMLGIVMIVRTTYRWVRDHFLNGNKTFSLRQ